MKMQITSAMVSAAIESRAKDDEGEFQSLGDLIGFSGDNKTRCVVRRALEAALYAANVCKVCGHAKYMHPVSPELQCPKFVGVYWE